MLLADRLRRALAPESTQTLIPGDHFDFGVDHPRRAAAVLMAVTDTAQPTMILTQRTETLRNHAGQVAFPGGRIDPEDHDAVAAALREAEEEIALPRQSVEIVAPIDRYRTVTGFEVTPILGVVPSGLALVPSEAEVASVFEVPLSFLLDSRNHRQAQAVYKGRERHFYEIMWEDRRIWGATAAMIVNLSRRLHWPA